MKKVIMFRVNVVVLPFCIILVMAMCHSISAQGFSGDNHDTLAVIGSKVITVQDFKTAYKDKLLRVGLTDNSDTRIKYLLNLVDDEVLIADAKNRGLDKSKTAKAEYERIKTQELLNAFSVKYIEPTIVVTEDDIRSMYIRMNTKIKVRHLYARSKEEADKIYKELGQGRTFDDLAKEIFHDPKLRDNGGDLGYISVDDMDPAFENAAFAMKPGEISPPVKTVTGYSVIKVEDKKTNPFVIESEYLKAHERIKAFVTKRAYEDATKRYTAQQKEMLAVTLNKTLLAQLYAVMQAAPDASLAENASALLKKDKNTVVVQSKAGKWDLKTLIREMQATSEEQRKWIHSQNDLEDFVSGLMLRKNIVRKALAAHLDTAASFAKKVAFNFGTWLMTMVEKELRENIKISPDSIKAYYVQNSDRYMKEAEMRLSSILVNNASTADSVARSLKNGVPFEKLAGQASLQAGTAKNGGDMGFFRRSDLGKLAEQVFRLHTGEWLGPVADSVKYLFLKCTDLKAPVMRSLEEVRGEIEQTLTTLNWFKIRKEYANALGNSLKIRIFPEKVTVLNLLTKVDNK